MTWCAARAQGATQWIGFCHDGHRCVFVAIWKMPQIPLKLGAKQHQLAVQTGLRVNGRGDMAHARSGASGQVSVTKLTF